MARLLVGLPALSGKLKSYSSIFDMVELRPVDTSLPALKKLRGWREQVPPSFVFSVIMPRCVAELRSGPEVDQAIEQSLNVATAVQAGCVLVCTPPAVRPTKVNRERLAALFERLNRPGQVLGWESSGLWEVDDVLETAGRLGVLAVLDAARDPLPRGPIAYTRIKTIGHAARLGAGSIERIAEQLQDRRDAYVVVTDKTTAKKVKASLEAVRERQQGARSGPLLFRPGLPPSLVADDEEQ